MTEVDDALMDEGEMCARPLAAALEYAERGWAVFPLHTVGPQGCSCGSSDCSNPGKHPQTRNGFKDATIDLEQIRIWWSRWPEANVGIATGAGSGLVVLDLDAKSDGEASLAALEAEHGPLPRTVTASTGGGGRHLLFAHPGAELRNSAGKLGVGLDVRGDGGYIVASPSRHESGRQYQWQPGRSPGEVELTELPSWLLRLLTVRPQASAGMGGASTVARDDGPIPEGQRNASLASIAGRLRRHGKTETEIYLALVEENQRRCQPPLPEREVASIAASISRYDPAPSTPSWLRFKWTEYGNGERLVDRHGADLRHSAGLGWLAWDGQRWRRDEDGEAMRRMKETVRAMWAELPEIDDPDQQKKFFFFVRSSENERRLNAGLNLAESEARIVIAPDALDADRFLLTVANGTLDLRTSELREHARHDLITKASSVVYLPGARSELWQQFLDTVTGGDDELARFLQRAAGYSLTGDTSEEKLFFAHGPAATGKSSFLEALKGVLGEYATTTDFETLLKRKGDRGIPNDIARLAGTRLVLSIEVEDGKQLAAGLVKTLTGGDTVVARYLRKEFFEFQPQFKLWLAANDRPRVNASDTGIWRRIVQVPFAQAIPEDQRDPTVKQRLRQDAEVQQAILVWAVQGCLAWQQDGLQIPERVRAYTEEYRQENDPLAEFFDECCLFGPDARVSRARLRTVYGHWAQRRFQKPWSAKAFADELKRRGVTDGGKLNGDRAWQGVRLTDKAEASETQWERFDLF